MKTPTSTATLEDEIGRVLATLVSKVGLATNKANLADQPFSNLSVANEVAIAKLAIEEATETAHTQISNLLLKARIKEAILTKSLVRSNSIGQPELDRHIKELKAQLTEKSK